MNYHRSFLTPDKNALYGGLAKGSNTNLIRDTYYRSRLGGQPRSGGEERLL